MCLFCGCGESGFQSVAVILPSDDQPEPTSVGVYGATEAEEEN